MRALCWRLSLAVGAGIQAKRVTTELQLKAEASEKFERVLDALHKDLETAKRLHRAVLEEASRLRLEVKEVPELRKRCDEVCSELARVISKHAEEMGAAQREFNEGRNRLIKETSEERARLKRMLDESEDKVRKLTSHVASRDERIKWDQATLGKLREELSRYEAESNEARQKIKGLKETVDRVKADKIRAFDKVDELSEAMARQKAEAERMELDSRRQLEALREELVLSQQRGSDFEERAVGSEAQVTLLQSQNASFQDRATKAEFELALLKGAQDVDCRKAFRLGIEETRAVISRQYPDLDLSFLEAEEFNARTPVAEASEESEYEDISDAEVDGPKVEGQPSETTASEAHTFEVGGPSRTSPMTAADSPETRPTP